MCEKLTSHLFKVREREMLVHTICSHSETRAALNLRGIDPNIIEVEWHEGCQAPDIRFSNQDADEQHLVRDWYAKRFVQRYDLINSCLRAVKGGSLDLGFCDLSKVTEWPKSIGGSLYLRGCDLSKVTELTLPKSIGGSLYLGGCDLSKVTELTLPKSIGGSLDLGGCDLSKVTEWPKSIGGSLYLGGCDLSKIVIPNSIKGKVIK
jgi:hypothetical protein